MTNTYANKIKFRNLGVLLKNKLYRSVSIKGRSKVISMKV